MHPMRPTPARASRPVQARGSRARLPFTVMHLYLVWAITLFDLHFFLNYMVAEPLIYVVYLGYPPLILMMFFQAPVILVGAKRWVWFAPLLLWLVVAGMVTPFATNAKLAKDSFQILLVMYVVTLGTAVYIKTPRQARTILIMLALQFAWYGAWAGTKGLVFWHPTLSNYDGFGSLMVGGVGLCYYFATATQNKKLKLFLYGVAAYCVLGVVASFARAAFLCLVAIIGWIWVRSPRKLATGAGIIVAAILVVVGASVIFDPGFFWNEITSAFTEGTEEGTGEQRMELWKVGFKVWMQSPIWGVGGGNVGAFAANHFRPGELEAFPNPGMLYGYNMHNSYVQVLGEFGLLGVISWVWIIWDFFKRNREIRTPEAARRWIENGGGNFDVRYLALGLEAANVANLINGMFYASLFTPGYYVIWAANRMLWSVTRPAPEAAPQPVRRPSARSGARAAVIVGARNPISAAPEGPGTGPARS